MVTYPRASLVNTDHVGIGKHGIELILQLEELKSDIFLEFCMFLFSPLSLLFIILDNFNSLLVESVNFLFKAFDFIFKVSYSGVDLRP